MIFYNAKIITQNKKRDILSPGYLVVSKNGYIEEVGINYPKVKSKETVINLGGNLLMPGLINAHVHLGDFFYKGKIANLNSPEVILSQTKKIDDKFRKKIKKIKYYASFFTLKKLLKNGITTIAGGQGIDQTRLSGLRFLGGCMIKGKEKIPLVIKKLKKECSASDLCFPGILIHSLLEVSPATLTILKKAIRKSPFVIMLHMGEFPEEKLLVFKKYGRERLDILKKAGFLNKRSGLIIVHGGYISRAELKDLSKYNIRFVLCPTSSASFKLKTANIKLLEKYGMKSAIGTDGPITNPRIDLINDVNNFYCSQGNKKYSRQSLLDKITIEAAKVLGINKIVGSIERGKFADIIIIKSKDVKNVSNRELLLKTIFNNFPKRLKSVMVGGKWVIKLKKPKK